MKIDVVYLTGFLDLLIEEAAAAVKRKDEQRF